MNKNVDTVTIKYTDGSEVVVTSPAIVLPYDPEAEQITIYASPKLSDVAIALICQQTARHIEELFLMEDHGEII